MNVKPIVVKDGAVYIPLEYLDNASAFELVVEDGVVVVRPKTTTYEQTEVNGVKTLHDKEDTGAGKKSLWDSLESIWAMQEDERVAEESPEDQAMTAKLLEKYPWIGMVDDLEPCGSEWVEEFCLVEVNSRSGLTTKIPLE